MAKRRIWIWMLLLGAIPAARAQFAVIDVASLTQLMTQVNTLEQQVATARSQLSQAQSEFQAMTGARGMERLLGGTQRNYLPTSWPGVQDSLLGSSSYPALAAGVRVALQRDSVLSAAQLATLSQPAGAQLQAQRSNAALLQGLTHESLVNSSGRFAALQQLIDAIPSAGDQKAILDLQARIAAESGMLQNEHTKLQMLYAASQAERWAGAQRLRELAIAGHGQFADRFQPHP